MRQIIFRGKSLFANHKWLYGSLLILNGKYYICPLKADVWNMTKYQVVPDTVGQFTGLIDNNCVEIYEGDIIKDQYGTGKVIYHIEDADFCLKGKFGVISIRNKESEVIGNIFDNKILLEDIE